MFHEGPASSMINDAILRTSTIQVHVSIVMNTCQLGRGERKRMKRRQSSDSHVTN